MKITRETTPKSCGFKLIIEVEAEDCLLKESQLCERVINAVHAETTRLAEEMTQQAVTLLLMDMARREDQKHIDQSKAATEGK